MNTTDPRPNSTGSPPSPAAQCSAADDSGEKLKRSDQIRMLQAVLKYTETGKWEGLFTYPNCGWDLVQMGLAKEDKKITSAGRAALWLLNIAPDPTTSKAVETLTLPKPPNA